MRDAPPRKQPYESSSRREYHEKPLSNTLFIGNLATDAVDEEVQDIFHESEFGPVKLTLKTKNG